MMLSEETSAVRPPKQTRFNGAKLVWMLKGSPLTVTGAVIIVLMLLMMIFSPWLATHDPNAIDLTARLLPPSAAHWFGTDEVGRDLFSRVLVGSQQSILAGLVVVAIAGMMGSLQTTRLLINSFTCDVISAGVFQFDLQIREDHG